MSTFPAVYKELVLRERNIENVSIYFEFCLFSLFIDRNFQHFNVLQGCQLILKISIDLINCDYNLFEYLKHYDISIHV